MEHIFVVPWVNARSDQALFVLVSSDTEWGFGVGDFLGLDKLHNSMTSENVMKIPFDFPF